MHSYTAGNDCELLYHSACESLKTKIICMQLTWIDRKFSRKNTYKLFLVHSWSIILYVCSPSRHNVNQIWPATLTSAAENLIVYIIDNSSLLVTKLL